MFELIGIREWVELEFIGGDWVSEFDEERVALFSSRRLAERFVEDCRLVRPREGWCVRYPFRVRSLLSRYTGVDIVEFVAESDVPVDPVA